MDPTFLKSRREPPWRAGLRAARANVIPGLIVQAAMLLLLLAYYYYEPTTQWLDRLAALKNKWGYGFSALASIVAGAFIPEILRIAVFQQGRVTHWNFTNLVFSIPFWGTMGMIVDALYRGQALMFGSEASLNVVVAKVLFDQLIYSPVVSAPLTAWLYDWKNSNYSLNNLNRFFTRDYILDVIVPLQFAGWGVWIPLVTIIYSLPSLLQIPMFALALSLWVTLFTWMSEQRVAANET